MKDKKISAIVGLSVTLLAVVTAISFSVATVTYQKEATKLKKLNKQNSETIAEYTAVLKGIKQQLMKVQGQIQ